MIRTMKPADVTSVCFLPAKYGRPLAIDASSAPAWRGIVANGEPHVLDFHEFLVVSRGVADLTVGSATARIEGPAILFTPPRTIRRVTVDDPLQVRLVVFSAQAVRRSSWSASLARMVPGPLPGRDAATVAAVDAMAQSMSAEVLAPSPEADRILETLLARLITTVSNSSGEVVEPSAIVRRFERLLEQHFREHHDVAAYASALGLTADHVSVAVRAHHGVSAKALIDRRVFVEATRLLTATTAPIAEVGAMVGFDEAAHFTRFIVRMCGRPPSRHRRPN
jgi:AraC family transcriptional activator of pobA